MYETNTAHGYTRHAVFHRDEDVRHYIEHYGRTRPTAKIL
jgi:hypothetical protein